MTLRRVTHGLSCVCLAAATCLAADTSPRDVVQRQLRVISDERQAIPRYLRGPDPDIKPGFPVTTLQVAGSYQGGPGIHVLVGNIDDDPQQEIVYTGITSGYLWAWNHDGTVVPGWPLTAYEGAPYPALGQLSSVPQVQAFTAHLVSDGNLAALSGDATPLPGWPRRAGNYVSSPPALVDVDGDGLAEIFICEEDDKVHGYRANGTVLPGWPAPFTGGAQWCETPAVTDLDNDGVPEIVAITGWTTAGARFLKFHANGTMASGFPIVLSPTFPLTFTVVGDVDGDGELEIAFVVPVYGQTMAELRIYSASGRLERAISTTAHLYYGTAPALADLDGDGVPEIIVATEYAMFVWRGDGSLYPGWPQFWGNQSTRWLGNSSPVVGDIDGDGGLEIALTSLIVGAGNDNELHVFETDGTRHSHFPKYMPLGLGAVPAIADIDLDGRNELVIGADFWPGYPGFFDAIWAFDVGGGSQGRIEWGQLMGGASHSGRYTLGITPVRLGVDDAQEGNGNGVMEAGEGARVAAVWRNFTDGALTLSGTISGFTGPSNGQPQTYQLRDGSAVHGTAPAGALADCRQAGGDCYGIFVAGGGPRPAVHWDATLKEDLSAGRKKAWAVHIGDSFADVPRTSLFYRYVETLLHRGITTGCAATAYCPSAPSTREQMAVFALVAREGVANPPKPCGTPVFADVPASSPYCRWIEELARRQIVSGCGNGLYCPQGAVTREQMAVFALHTYDPTFQPPECTAPMFGDVPASSPFCRWIEELARRGVVSGCGGGNYCPNEPVTREQMSVFLALTFGLSLYSGN